MAFSSSNSCISSVISISPVSPSSRIISSVVLNLLTPSLILRLPSATSFSTFSAKPIFSKTTMKPLRAATQQKYVYPDPIPEFAEDEIQKFRDELRKKLSKNKESFGNDLDNVVAVCAEILSDFLHKEYGGPGTLLVEPFTDMLVALKEKKLPGAPVAARAALLWAQNYLDKDWEMWTSRAP